MSKYAMLNCWNDLNKGDLGIMLATVEEIKAQDPDAEIIGISSFSAHDDIFKNNHKDLKAFVPKVFSAIFGVSGIQINGKYHKGFIFKIFSMLLETVRYTLCMYSPLRISAMFLTEEEQKTLKIIQTCDVSFSKGGTVFMDYGNKRGAIALRRVCRFFDVLKKFNCPYYLLGQSFGPISDRKELLHTNSVIRAAEKVYIREKVCLKEYPEIELNGKNVSFSNDFAFLIKGKEVTPNPIDLSVHNVGMTVRSFGDDKKYLECLKRFIEFLVLVKKANVHIFQQVAMDTEPDNITAELILKELQTDVKEKVIYHTEHYLPQELCWLYGQMDLFIGTRLHSTIFSMCAGTPTIGMVYHGTKAQGIFKNIGVEELIIDNPVTYEKLVEKYEYVMNNSDQYRQIMRNGVNKARQEAKNAIGDLVEYAHREK